MPIDAGQIKREARRLGFEKVGIAKAVPLGAEGERLKDWLARGYQATMGWMGRNADRRIDPENVLAGARSIVSVALNYYTDVRHPDDDQAGKISRYAWGDDYHTILALRLERLLAFVRDRDPHANGKAYVDTGPIMEKAWAQRAGIGWIGKHTNIITGDLGSWVFLGEIILDIDLECDPPATDHCGSCTRCIDACPTHAIVEPYVLDASRCISYLTIEHRGELPASVEGELNGWIYGCDVCQDVCPWNLKFSRPTGVAGFLPREGNVSPPIESVAAMTLEEFNSRFAGSPIKRAKHAGLTRNAACVLHHRTTVSR